jgi:translation initiation factor eIF-2B subunit beta
MGLLPPKNPSHTYPYLSLVTGCQRCTNINIKGARSTFKKREKPASNMTAVASAVPVASENVSKTVIADAEVGRLSSSDPEQMRGWLRHHSHRKQLIMLDHFLDQLQRQRMTQQTYVPDRRRMMAQTTVNLLRNMIGSTTWKTAAELLHLLRGIGRELSIARDEPAIHNVVRRVMAAVREEALREAQEAEANNNNNLGAAATANTAGDGRLSLQSMLWALPQHVRSSSRGMTTHSLTLVGSSTATQRQESIASEAECFPEPFPTSYYAARPNLKQAVLEAVQEIMSDLELLHRNINEQASNHIHSGEVILICGRSKTVELFLREAFKKTSRTQSFAVIVCGSGSYEMAKSLSVEGIDTTYIEEAAAFAVMTRVHKVILPAYAVLANGGLVTAAGCNLVALAARHHSVPVVCVTGLFKLCPMFPHQGQDTLQNLTSPLGTVIDDYAEFADPLLQDVELVHPEHDYIEPKYITLYITNVGSFQPSFIYRLLAENYHHDDWQPF